MWHCLDTLDLYTVREPGEIEAIAFEIARLGPHGIDDHNPDHQYTPEILPGRSFSGLHLLALMYVGLKQTHPELVDVGIDLAAPYEAARALHALVRTGSSTVPRILSWASCGMDASAMGRP